MALTEAQVRASILGKLNDLSTEKLVKLSNIVDSIMSPMDTELTSVDFSSMMNQVFRAGGLADRYFPKWTDRSDSDFGRFVVEISALFSDKDFFYMNHYSKEGFLGVAEEYRSIFHKALNVGFNPPSRVSSRGDVELLYSAGNTEIVPRGSVVLGISQVPELVYTNEEFTIPQSSISSSVTVPFVHGKVVNETNTFDGYSIFIDTIGISSGSVRLIIDGYEWMETDTFLGGTPSTKHFMVVYDGQGKAELLFARGGMGTVPDKNQTYFVEYIIGGGYIGDLESNVLDLVLSNATSRNLVSFTQFSMTGGNDLMPLETLRQTVIGKQRHQNRVVTPEDAEYFCNEFTFVKKVKTEAFLGFLYIYILPTGGGDLSTSQRNLITNKLNNANDDERKLLLGYNLNVSSPIYVPLKMVVDLYVSSTTIKSSAEIKARQTLQEVLDPQKDGTFGVGVNRSMNVSTILSKVAGATNVVFSTLHRLGTPMEANDINFVKREVVDWDNSEITINVIGGV